MSGVLWWLVECLTLGMVRRRWRVERRRRRRDGGGLPPALLALELVLVLAEGVAFKRNEPRLSTHQLTAVLLRRSQERRARLKRLLTP